MADSAPSQIEFPHGTAHRLEMAVIYLRAVSARLTAVFADVAGDDPTDSKYKVLTDEIHLLDQMEDRLQELRRVAERQAIRRESGDR